MIAVVTQGIYSATGRFEVCTTWLHVNVVNVVNSYARCGPGGALTLSTASDQGQLVTSNPMSACSQEISLDVEYVALPI